MATTGSPKNFAPIGKAAIGGEDHGALFVAGVDELEEQIGGGRERSSARLGLSRSTLHAACAIDKLRRREAPSNARWAAYCATVRARSSTLDGGAPERWRRSNGPAPSTNQSVLFRHLTNANSRAWEHSLRSRSCRYQIGRGCCTSRQNSSIRCHQVRRASWCSLQTGSGSDSMARSRRCKRQGAARDREPLCDRAFAAQAHLRPVPTMRKIVSVAPMPSTMGTPVASSQRE